jgi:hypothetical protein
MAAVILGRPTAPVALIDRQSSIVIRWALHRYKVLNATLQLFQPQLGEALFDQPDGERILIEFSFPCFYRRNDYKHSVQDPKRDQYRNADKDDTENRGNCVVNQHRDLEIQRFFSVGIDFGRIAAFYQPNDQRAENVTQKMKKYPQQCAGVAQYTPGSNIRGSGWRGR